MKREAAVKIILATLALLSLSACVQATTPVADTHDADLAAIQTEYQASAAAWTTKDMDKIVAQYASDATLVIANAPVARGPQEIRGVLTELFKDPLAKVSLEITTSDVSGNLGYLRGNYTLNVTDPKTKQPITEKGTSLMVYKKQPDGAWKVVEDFNAPGPPQ